ncbi:hypothetical protein FJTKL_05400 [Diaporthe vaccinii]|uniref:Uncharacterized protein n=1 Tax=Diaporthe vaccinii TaxID=105482 RepID=A0ABR4FFP3_9PEZI
MWFVGNECCPYAKALLSFCQTAKYTMSAWPQYSSAQTWISSTCRRRKPPLSATLLCNSAMRFWSPVGSCDSPARVHSRYSLV